MSRKIPQSEWGAIAARREQGESLSAIARSYGCSAPTIHAILNRFRESQAGADAAPAEAPAATAAPADAVEKRGAQEEPAPLQASLLPDFLTRPVARPAPRPEETAPSAVPAAEPAEAAPRRERPVLRPNGNGGREAIDRPSGGASSVPGEGRRGPERFERPDRRPSTGAPAAPRDFDRDERPAPVAPPPHALAQRPEALTAALDAELRAHVETVMEAFRAAFDQALGQNAPEARDALRRAASELMRAGARTTIVLERLEAASHRPNIPPRHERQAPDRHQQQDRPPHANGRQRLTDRPFR